MPAASPFKICTKCDEPLPLADFGKNRYAKDGLHYYCRICSALKRKVWYESNKKKASESTSRWKKEQARRNGLPDGKSSPV